MLKRKYCVLVLNIVNSSWRRVFNHLINARSPSIVIECFLWKFSVHVAVIAQNVYFAVHVLVLVFNRFCETNPRLYSTTMLDSLYKITVFKHKLWRTFYRKLWLTTLTFTTFTLTLMRTKLWYSVLALLQNYKMLLRVPKHQFQVLEA